MNIRAFYIAVMMGAVRTSETSVYSNENTRRYIPEGFNVHLEVYAVAVGLFFEVEILMHHV
jgi:hypothetical protein